jgi:hypothetical protein
MKRVIFGLLLFVVLKFELTLKIYKLYSNLTVEKANIAASREVRLG